MSKASPLIIALLLLVLMVACQGKKGPLSGLTTTSDRTAPAEVGTPSVGHETDGGWESSGGDGVACFANVADAGQAKQDLSVHGFLSLASRDKIKTLEVLDAWDFFGKSEKANILSARDYGEAKVFQIEKQLLDAKTADQVMALVLKNVSIYTPLLSQRVEMVRRLAPISSWLASNEVASVDDSHPVKPIADHCVLIQLARRQTNSENGKLPQVKITYDKELVEKFLTPVDQALLAMHEYFYLIAKEGGHENSDEVRRFVTFLFSHQAMQFADDVEMLYKPVLGFRMIVAYPFGDYIRFFMQEPDLQKQVSGLNQYSRYLSLLSLMNKMRASMATCMGTGKPNQDCQKQVHENNPDLWNSLSNEEAFLFLARFNTDQTLYDVNSEYLVVWNEENPGEVTQAQQDEGKMTCELIGQISDPKYVGLHDKSVDYCRDAFQVEGEHIQGAPLRTELRCHNQNSILEPSETTDALQIRVYIDVDKATGEPKSVETFGGRVERISRALMEKGSEDALYKDYATEDVYRLTPVTDADRESLKELIRVEPQNFRVLKSVTRTGFTTSVDVLNSAEAIKVLSDSKNENSELKVDFKFQCSVTETRLPGQKKSD